MPTATNHATKKLDTTTKTTKAGPAPKTTETKIEENNMEVSTDDQKLKTEIK